MPINIADTGTVAAKYARNGASAGAVEDYKKGIQSPNQPQAASAIASADLWQDAVSSDDAKVGFKDGLQKSGDAKWSRNALDKGANRLPDGVRKAQGDYATAVDPFLTALRNTTLPPKGLRGSPQNVARVVAVDDLMIKTAG